MNYINELSEIKQIFNANCYKLVARDMENAQMVLETKGKMFSSVINTLNQLKQNNSLADSLVQPEVDELITYAASIGY
jgi:hypothetical protein